MGKFKISVTEKSDLWFNVNSDEPGIVLLPGKSINFEDNHYVELTDQFYKIAISEIPGLNISFYNDDLRYESQHSADIIIPIIEICGSICISLFANLLYDFIKSRIRVGEEKETNVQLKILKTDGEQCTLIEYDGTIDGLERIEEILK